jgi:ABC-2 type transport system permease protein
MNLFVAELWRFWSRRVTKITLIAIVVLTTIGMAIAAANSTYDTTSSFRTVSDDCETATSNAEGEMDFSRCPIVTVYGEDDRVRFNDLGDILGGMGSLLVLASILLAASSLGGEFGAASLSTQLLFEPRRVRVWSTKAAAIAVGTAMVTLISALVIAGELYVVASTRGVVDTVGDSWWSDRTLDVARLVSACGIGAVLGFSITGIARRTVAAVVGFIVLFIAEPLLYHATDVFDRRLPMLSLMLFVANPFDDEFFDPGSNFGFSSLTQAVLPPLLWAAVLLVITGWQFRRTEIR